MFLHPFLNGRRDGGKRERERKEEEKSVWDEINNINSKKSTKIQKRKIKK